MWSFAAAFLARCRAQSMLLRTIRELLVDECDGVTPGREHAREVLRRRRRRVEDVRRDEVDYLPENGGEWGILPSLLLVVFVFS